MALVLWWCGAVVAAVVVVSRMPKVQIQVGTTKKHLITW
jgi:hypothetical protein